MVKQIERVAALALLAAAAACGSTATSPSAGSTLSRVMVTQPSATAERNSSLQLNAQAQFSDGTTSDITSAATWSTSNPSVAIVTADAVSIVGLGVAQIMASY